VILIYIIIPNLKLRINIFTICVVMLLLYLENPISVLLLLSAAFIHELGHFVAMKIFGAVIKRVDIEPFGATIVFDSSKSSYRSELKVALGGPLLGLFTSGACWLLFTYYPSPHLLLFLLANLAFSVINLIPFSTLDGGLALKSWLLSKYELTQAEKIVKVISLISVAILCILSIMVLNASGYNISLLALTAFQIVILFGNIISGI